MNRVIRKSRTRSSTEAASLLANLFAAELVSPSECIWLVSPWISDIQILDNEASAFDPLNRWGPRIVRLAEVLATLAFYGSSVVIGTTADSHNDEFLAHLSRRAAEFGAGSKVRIVRDPANLLHDKAITGDDYAVVGSMNITWYGVNLRDEHLELRTDEDFVAGARLDAIDRFGFPS
jgi:hypothetical protein